MVVSPNDKDNLAIIAHELSHIRHYHWVDLVIAQVLLIFQWWNPAAWFAMRDLRTIHEYQADAAVLNLGYNKTQYQLLLLNRVAQSTDAIISDSFDSGSLRRRIVMMGCKPKRYLLPFLVLIPLILSAVALPKFGDMAPYSPHVDLDEIAQDITAQFLSEIKYPAEVGSQSGIVLMELSFNPARQELYGAIVNSSGISAFDNEALRVVKSLKPDVSYIKGEASQITFTVPIIFKPS